MSRTSIILSFFLAVITVLFIVSSFDSSKKSYVAGNNMNVMQDYNQNFELDIVKSDLYTTNELSESLINAIIGGIDSSSREFNVPVGLLHSIFRVESEYRFWITHPKITIKLSKGKVTTNAIGLGGIVWEAWSDSLIKKNIAFAKSDLYRPLINIRSAAAILNIIINQEIKSTTEWSIIRTIIRRYYGAYDHDYHSKLMKITSDLWLKRIAKEIVSNYADTTNIN